MKNIFKTSKCGIAAILILCILLGIAGTCMNVTAMAEDTTVATEETAVATEEITTVVVEETTVATEETTRELIPMMARGCHVDTWTDPRNLTEQLALEAAMSNPTIGVQLPIILLDPRWPSSGGWYKYQYSGNGFNLHYVYNIITGESADFKFVLD